MQDYPYLLIKACALNFCLICLKLKKIMLLETIMSFFK